jgi:hypothetical protein
MDVERQPAVMGTGKVLETHSLPAAMSKDLRDRAAGEGVATWRTAAAGHGTAARAAVAAVGQELKQRQRLNKVASN